MNQFQGYLIWTKHGLWLVSLVYTVIQENLTYIQVGFKLNELERIIIKRPELLVLTFAFKLSIHLGL